ncbi:hypothetical protein ABIE37_001923 [Arthrobacter bambusae]|uniref:Uncharacterized protein n=1 Tax=Arthrobacter bambusae TaxID=1338426 RepID=A0ABV2P5T9_9MICC
MLEKRRQELRGKYLKLGTGELVAACVFALVASTIVMPRLSGPGDHFAMWSALIPLLVILVQAGVYWLLARGFNYFVIRLSYPVNQWFARVGKRNVPQLVQDFSVDSRHR